MNADGGGAVVGLDVAAATDFLGFFSAVPGRCHVEVDGGVGGGPCSDGGVWLRGIEVMPTE